MSNGPNEPSPLPDALTIDALTFRTHAGDGDTRAVVKLKRLVNKDLGVTCATSPMSIRAWTTSMPSWIVASWQLP